MDYPKKTGNMYSTTDTERAHAPVEMSKPVENETNYRANQNMKTDQRHTKKKLEFTKLTVRVGQVYHSSDF